MKIVDKLALASDGGYSLEFFPPKTEKGVENLKKRVENFYQSDQSPLFIDLTWGAGGSTSELTLDLAKYWTKLEFDVNMHLTCTNMPAEMIDSALNEAELAGINNLLPLRGDPPTGDEGWKKTEGGFECAMDLVNYINRTHEDKFCLTVSGYPEGHQSKIKELDPTLLETLTPSEKQRLSRDPMSGKYYVCRDADYWDDLHYLKKKIDAGGNMIITQLFFDVDLFLQFVEDCRSIAITCPILPGIMLVQSTGGFRRMTTMCRTKVPEEIWEKIKEVEEVEKEETGEKKSNAILEYGEELGQDMCRQLFEGGVKFFHLYTLNRERVAKSVIQYICEELLV